MSGLDVTEADRQVVLDMLCVQGPAPLDRELAWLKSGEEPLPVHNAIAAYVAARRCEIGILRASIEELKRQMGNGPATEGRLTVSR